jgi:leucyl/phenylalanyl-tRNA---protein transferase
MNKAILDITPELLLRAYAVGVFPMAEDASASELLWFDPVERGVLPLNGLHISRSLRKIVRGGVFTVTVNQAFERIIDLCAEPAGDRPRTWINGQIRDLYCRLHRMGFVHSVECWQGEVLCGGLYGVALGGAFFGESMVSRRPNASKVALVHLVARLRAGRFTLLDTQFVTDHLRRMGASEVPRAVYKSQLAAALKMPGNFYPPDIDAELHSLLSAAEGAD